MSMRFLFYVYLILLSACASQAQNYSTKNKKAIKTYEEAVRLFNQKQDSLGISTLQAAIEQAPQFIEAHLTLADIFFEKKQYSNAIKHYKEVIKIDEQFFTNIYFNLGNAQLKNGEYAAAIESYNYFLKQEKLTPIIKSKAEYQLEQAKIALQLFNQPVDFKPVNMGENINSIYDEYLPTLTADEQQLIITRRRPADKNTQQPHNGYEEDFYISIKKDGEWQMAKPLGEPINTNGNEGSQSISANGQELFFTACHRKDGLGRCDIYWSQKQGEKWTIPVNLGRPVNSESWESQPSISADGQTLYFVSNRKGSKGETDIWVSQRLGDNKWSEPVNLGNMINTSGSEMSPFIHHDNQTLYFASNKLPGLGEHDIFYTKKDENGNWQTPVNIGYPINTHADENSLIVSASGLKGYFATSRLNGRADMDLYEFELPEKTRPQPVNYVKGLVYDADTHEKIEANFDLIDIETGQTVLQSKSSAYTGEFLICLPSNKNYMLNVNKPGYLFFSENYSLKGNRSLSEPFLIDIPLQKITIGKKVILKNIFFDTNAFELKPESQVELGKLIALLQNQPQLKIEIGGHTDNVGNKKDNLILSEKRSKAVYDYLLQKGNIDKSRISYKGFGDTQPLNKNLTPAEQAQNRRTEIKVIGY